MCPIRKLVTGSVVLHDHAPETHCKVQPRYQPL